MKIKDDELKSILIDLKKVIKGRPLYFGLMAPAAKRGKFRLSKKKGDTKPPTIKSEFNPYEDDKDNKLKGSACQGVITAEKGVLTLHIDGKAPGAAVKFLTHFILREVKYKVVKKVVVAEDAQELPVVPEDDDGLNWQQLLSRLTQLMTEVRQLTDEQRKPILTPALSAKQIIDQQDAATAEELQQADNLLDDAFGLLSELERSSGNVDTPSTIDDAELQKHLEHAKEMAAILPSNRITNLASQISEGNRLLAAGDLENAEDVILGLEDEIDGTFQDYFLDQLKGMGKHESTMPQEIQQAMDVVRREVRGRRWPEAIDAWNRAKNLVVQFKVDSGEAAPVPEAPAAPKPPPLPTPPTAATEDVDQRESWQLRHSELQEQHDALEKQNSIDPDSSKKVVALLKKSEELALEQYRYSQAAVAHGGVHQILIDVLDPAEEIALDRGVTPGLVAFRQSQLQWKLSLQDVDGGLRKLSRAIESTSPEHAELAKELGVVLTEFENILEDIIDEGINADDDTDRMPHGEEALRLISELQRHVLSDELIEHLDECPFCQVDIRGTLTSTLNDLSKRLTAFMAG